MVNTYGSTPAAFVASYVPDTLIGGDLKRVTATVTVAQASAITLRGTVMGVTTSTGYYTTALSAANDGSQTPTAILVDNVDSTGGPVQAGVYLSGEFDIDAVTFGAGITAAGAFETLRTNGIFLKNPLPNTHS